MDFPMLHWNRHTIGIIGLGYVGLPLAVEFGKKFQTIGFDLNQRRLAELQSGTDSTLEVSDQELQEATQPAFHLRSE